MTFLLDTNVCIQYLRGRSALVLQRIQARPSVEIRLCSIVISELLYGCLRSVNPTASRAGVQAFVQPFRSLPFDDAAAAVQADIRVQLEVGGISLEPYDLQIAAIALVNNLTLVTHDSKHFGRVPGLLMEDWEIP